MRAGQLCDEFTLPLLPRIPADESAAGPISPTLLTETNHPPMVDPHCNLGGGRAMVKVGRPFERIPEPIVLSF